MILYKFVLCKKGKKTAQQHTRDMEGETERDVEVLAYTGGVQLLTSNSPCEPLKVSSKCIRPVHSVHNPHMADHLEVLC